MSNTSRERNCCNDKVEHHDNKGHLLSNMQSPLQQEMKKYELEKNHMIGRVPFIPFLDNGDATNRVITNLVEVSPTHAACKDKFKKYMRPFNTITFKRKADLFVNEQEENTPVNDSEFLEFRIALLEIFGKAGLLDLSKTIDREIENYLVYGNNIAELILMQNGTAKMAKIVSYDFGMFRLENPPDPNDIGKYGYICEDFARVNLDLDVEYQRYSMYPNFEEWPDGTLRCLIHTFDPEANRIFYGLPFTFASINAQFTEFQAGKYLATSIDNKFLASMIVESEAPAQDMSSPEQKEKEQEKKIKKFNALYTMQGVDNSVKSPIIPLMRPHGAAASTFKDILSNFDADSHKLMYEISESQIMRAWGMHAGLLEQGGSSLSGGNYFYEIALNFYYTSIQPAIDKCLRSIQIAIEEAQNWVGYQNPNNLAITLPMPEFIKKVKREEAAAENNNTTSNNP